MLLTDQDQRMLDGSQGRLVAESMRFLVRLGEAFDADRMIDIQYAYVYMSCLDSWGSGDFSENLLEEGLACGTRCKVPTTTWVPGREVDERLYDYLGITGDQLAALDKEVRIGKGLGMIHVDTCTPHLIGDVGTPAFGAHIASVESSAVTYFNTALGARCNRDGLSAFFASITGRLSQLWPAPR